MKYLFIAVLVFSGLFTINIQDMTEGDGRQWRQGIRRRLQHCASGSVRSALWPGGPSPEDQKVSDISKFVGPSPIDQNILH